MKLRLTLIVAGIALGASTAAFGDGDQKPMYGGVVAIVKDIQYELVAKPDSVTVFILDHGKKVGTKGATGKLTLLSGSEKTEVALASVGENSVGAKGVFKVAPGTKAVVMITLEGKPPASARFEIK